MLDLLHINIATNKLLMDQIVQMNTMIDENFDQIMNLVSYLILVWSMVVFV